MTKLKENEHAEYHVNFATDYIDKELRKVDDRGLSLGDHRCILIIDKGDDSRHYVVFDGYRKPILESHSWEDLEFKIAFYRMSLRDKLDIRRMAETGEIPRVF